ncbi:unnamed protein product [Cunninghamella echinulata]
MFPNHYSLKRMHSPSNNYDANLLSSSQAPLRKKIHSEDIHHFTNQIAAMSLKHNPNNNINNNNNNNINIEPLYPISPQSTISINNYNNNNQKNNVIRIDDINEFLSDDEENDYNKDDIHIGNPEIIEVNVNNMMLPMEKVPGSSNLKVPEFIIHYNDPPDNAPDLTMYQIIQHQLKQHQNEMDSSLNQPMDID